MEFIKYPYAKRGTKLNYNPYRYKNGEIYIKHIFLYVFFINQNLL